LLEKSETFLFLGKEMFWQQKFCSCANRKHFHKHVSSTMFLQQFFLTGGGLSKEREKLENMEKILGARQGQPTI